MQEAAPIQLAASAENTGAGDARLPPGIPSVDPSVETHTGSQGAQGDVKHAQAARQLLVDAVKQFQASQVWLCVPGPQGLGAGTLQQLLYGPGLDVGCPGATPASPQHIQAEHLAAHTASGSSQAVGGQRQFQASCWGSQVQTGLATLTQPPGRDWAAAAEPQGEAGAVHTCRPTRKGATVLLCFWSISASHSLTHMPPRRLTSMLGMALCRGLYSVCSGTACLGGSLRAS